MKFGNDPLVVLLSHKEPCPKFLTKLVKSIRTTLVCYNLFKVATCGPNKRAELYKESFYGKEIYCKLLISGYFWFFKKYHCFIKTFFRVQDFGRLYRYEFDMKVQLAQCKVHIKTFFQIQAQCYETNKYLTYLYS